MVKVGWILLVAFLASVVGAKLWSEASYEPLPGPVNDPWAQDTMRFLAWNQTRWTAWIRDGQFELQPADPGRWNRHAKPSVAFIDWDGEPWQAKIDGDQFLLARRGDWKGTVEKAATIRYRDWAGRNQVRTLAQLQR